MGQSLSSILIHLVFSTKHRKPWITPEIETELHPYLATLFRNQNCPSLAINGTADHLHFLFSLSRTITLADLVEGIKSSSSRWIKTKGPDFSDFQWQTGYGAFSIGQSQTGTVKSYIARQKEHHKQMSFQDELRELLTKYQVQFDERFVWD